MQGRKLGWLARRSYFHGISRAWPVSRAFLTGLADYPIIAAREIAKGGKSGFWSLRGSCSTGKGGECAGHTTTIGSVSAVRRLCTACIEHARRHISRRNRECLEIYTHRSGL